MSEKISDILKRNIKNLDKNVQRAELLARNRMFLKELEGISERLGTQFFSVKDLDERFQEESEDNILLKLNYPKTKRRIKKVVKDRYFKGLVDLDCHLYNNPKNLHERIE
ncbi:MAG: hypothetical protein MUO78_01030, partial [candidate division Zixibacteria bacterium]|nr:hypothetical protein [candidate division Zixibacteria bacterium]